MRVKARLYFPSNIIYPPYGELKGADGATESLHFKGCSTEVDSSFAYANASMPLHITAMLFTVQGTFNSKSIFRIYPT